MAIAIRGSTPLVVSTTANPISGTLTGTRQPQAGDLLVIFHGNDFYALSNMPTPTVGGSTSGVTAVTNGSADAGNPDAHVKAYTYAVGSTGDLIVAVTETGSGDEEKVLVVYVLSGADIVTPIDGGSSGAAGTASAGSGTASLVMTGVTPSGSDAFLIAHLNSGGGSAAGTPYTPPGTMAEQYDTSTGGVSYWGGTQQLAVSGATGTRTVTGSGSTTWAGVLLAVQTAGAGGGPPIQLGLSPFTMWPGDGPGGAERFIPDPRAVTPAPASVTEVGTTAYTTANTSTITTPTFTPDDGSLLVALVGAGNGVGGASSVGTVVDSLGGTWTRLGSDASATGAVTEVWARDITTGTPMTVTYDPGGAAASGLNIICKWYLGARPTAQQPGATGVNGGTTSYQTSITTTVAGSVVVGSYGRATDAQTVVANALTVLFGQFNGSAGDTVALLRSSTATVTPGALTLGFTNTPAGANRTVLVELLPTSTASTAAEIGTAPLGVTTYGTAARKQSQAGLAALGVAAVGAARKVVAQAGTCSVGLTLRGTAVRRQAQTGTAAAGVTTTGQAVKRTAHTGVAPAGLATTGLAVRVGVERGTAPLAVAALGAAAKRTPQAGSAPLGVAPWQTTALVPRAVEGRLTLSIVVSGTARKVATGQTGRAPLGVTTAGVDAKRAGAAGVGAVGLAARTGAVVGHGARGRAFIGLSATSTARKVGALAGTTPVGVTPTGRAVKRAATGGGATFGATATSSAAKQAACRGLCPLPIFAAFDSSVSARAVSGRTAVAIATWHHREPPPRITPRPYAGTTTRPSAGVTARPAGGTTARPGSGVTPRPFTGITARP